MIQITDKTLCSGCEACAQICPTQCISMVDDSEGFPYPVADPHRCIHCGLCEKVCPFLHKPEVNDESTEWAAAVNKDTEAIRRSSSGGIFSALALETLSRGGEVCGAGFNQDFSEVCHRWASTADEVAGLMGSKYVQSRVGECFREVREKLKAGLHVLFVGTPCQTAGLKNFLHGKSYPGLLLVDVLCHGVPSPMVWRRYLGERIDTLVSADPGLKDPAVDMVSFRDKRKGWEDYSVTIGISARDSDGACIRIEEVTGNADDLYMQGFLNNLYLRPACYSCPFRGQSYAGDITLGDCWGIERLCPSVDNSRGVSLVMAHTPNGKASISDFDILVRFGPSEIETLKKSNGGLVRNIGVNSQRHDFFKKLTAANSVSELIAHCLKPSLLCRIKGALQNKLAFLYK